MNYLLDKKVRQRKYWRMLIAVPVLAILIYFHAGIFRGLSTVTHAVLSPVLVTGNGVGGFFSNIGNYFSSKKSIALENEQLKSEMEMLSAKLANYDSILDKNNSLEEILGRKNQNTPMVLAGILSKPNRSPYDTLIVDAGNDMGIKAGDMVFALGNIPIGRVETAYGSSSRIVLFSSPGEKTEAVVPLTPVEDTIPKDDPISETPVLPVTEDTDIIEVTTETIPTPELKKSGKNVFAEVIGRGGGNFEILLPRDLSIPQGAEVTLPGINSNVLGIMQSIVSDSRESFQKALLVSPVNIQELKFVQVEVSAK